MTAKWNPNISGNGRISFKVSFLLLVLNLNLALRFLYSIFRIQSDFRTLVCDYELETSNSNFENSEIEIEKTERNILKFYKDAKEPLD